MFKEFFNCLSSCFIRIFIHLKCSKCCESDCMIDEGTNKKI